MMCGGWQRLTGDARLLQVARCTKIINPGTDEAKYVINVKQIAKVGCGRCLTNLLCALRLQVVLFVTVILLFRYCSSHPSSHVPFAMLQFVVGLGDKVAPTDIEEGMRVG